jgi:hypothetical protein
MRVVLKRLSAVLAIAACIPLASLAQSSDAATTQAPKGKYTVLPPRLYSEQVMPRASTLSLQTWNGSFSYSGTTYTYNMVGAAPSTNSSVSIPVYIIPVKIIVGRSGRQSTFDPAHVLSNGNTVTQNTVDSPLFTSSIDYKLGSIDVGTTQYIDAYSARTSGEPSAATPTRTCGSGIPPCFRKRR